MLLKNKSGLAKPVAQRPFLIAIATAFLAGGISFYGILKLSQEFPERPATASANRPPVITAVTGLGRLEPQGEVINLSAPTSVEGVRVRQLLVQEGNQVKVGQVVAILDNYEPRLAALYQARNQVQVAQARLSKVRAGAQTGTIAAQSATIARLQAELRGELPVQQATIDRLEAELANAESDYQRHQTLYDEGVISASLMDTKRLPVITLQKQINEARAGLDRTVQSYQEQISQARGTLNATAEVRPVDVKVAQAEVESAIAAVKQAEADLTLSYVRSPINGEVLKVHTRAGEIVTTAGIVELGQIDQMYAVTEIYETDIAKVRLGQKAVLTGAAFPGELEGVVAEIGRKVSTQNVLSTNPLADTDQKVIEVKVRIARPEDNRRVNSLTNLQVQVRILT
ncbi:MAG: ABC exporter membrane fusion protein [Aphanocapsa sp. GSE-SYN-MK-11-07L]|jgi:HlyD family secretion protein|nr:ABC exporter membrane fusion protein [Aphanocapsa sp. GSE-SYN-MK-11-07L]